MELFGATSGEKRFPIWFRVVLGALIAVGTIAASEPFFPGEPVREPGAIYFAVNFGIAYFMGLWPALISTLLFTLHIVWGPLIPGSAFEHTARNEVRAGATAFILATTAVALEVIRFRIRRESNLAAKERERAAIEAQRRTTAEQQLHESEELRDLIVESSRDAIIAVDHQSRIVLWNQHAESMLGWFSAHALGRTMDEVLGLEKLGAAGGRSEAILRTKAGLEVAVEYYAANHKRAAGDIHIIFMRDVSEQRRTEDAIRELNATLEQRVRDRTAELEAKNIELEGFSYAISHDLRSPLRTIVANARFVLEDEGERVSVEGRGQLERLAAAALRMSMLVDDLLQYARLGNEGLRIEQCNLSEIAETVAGDVQGQYPSARFTIGKKMSAMADPRLMAMLLTNLFDNACKYSKPDVPPAVKFYSVPNAGEVVYTVADKGVGFDMQYAGSLFQPFQRLHAQTQIPGTGIGLANVRRIIERHGGRIWIESEEGVGTSVMFTLSPDATHRSVE